jgi:predicted nucleotidyltransferase
MRDEPAARFREIYQLLAGAGIEFILVGGGAANLLGSARFTLDVDVVYRRDAANMQKIVDALQPLRPYLRGAPPGLPFELDLRTMRNGLNFTFSTDLGSIDFLGEIAGGGTYEQLLPHAIEKEFYGVRLRCVRVEKLIELKRAAGRPKDLEIIAELEAIRQEQRRIENERAEPSQ